MNIDWTGLGETDDRDEAFDQIEHEAMSAATAAGLDPRELFAQAITVGIKLAAGSPAFAARLLGWVPGSNVEMAADAALRIAAGHSATIARHNAASRPTLVLIIPPEDEPKPPVRMN